MDRRRDARRDDARGNFGRLGRRGPLVSPLPAVIVAVGLLGLALAIALRRRRRLEPAVPDPVTSRTPLGTRGTEPTAPSGSLCERWIDRPRSCWPSAC